MKFALRHVEENVVKYNVMHEHIGGELEAKGQKIVFPMFPLFSLEIQITFRKSSRKMPKPV